MVTWITLSVMSFVLTEAPHSQVNWLSDYATAYRQTRAEGVPLLVVLDNPAEAEHRIEQVSRRKPDETQIELLSNYKLCHVDVRTQYGQRLAKAFHADQFPHTVIIDNTASVKLFKKTGPFTTEEWVTTLVKYKSGNRQTVVRGNSGFSSGSPYICNT